MLSLDAVVSYMLSILPFWFFCRSVEDAAKYKKNWFDQDWSSWLFTLCAILHCQGWLDMPKPTSCAQNVALNWDSWASRETVSTVLYIYTCIYLYTCMYVYIYMYMYMYMYIYIYTLCMYVHTYIRTYVRTYMHACIHTSMHAYTHTHTHIIQAVTRFFCPKDVIE